MARVNSSVRAGPGRARRARDGQSAGVGLGGFGWTSQSGRAGQLWRGKSARAVGTGRQDVGRGAVGSRHGMSAWLSLSAGHGAGGVGSSAWLGQSAGYGAGGAGLARRRGEARYPPWLRSPVILPVPAAVFPR